MAKLDVKLQLQEVRKLLRSDEIRQECGKVAKQVAQRCGSGYGYDTYTGKNRANASVGPKTAAAYRDNLRNNTLLKGLKGANGG